MYYGIPVVVAASSNAVMPVSVTMVVMHELTRIPCLQLFYLGLLVKILLVVATLATVNATGSIMFNWWKTTPGPIFS
ncbi:unnamed protein product [Ixodes pacificus]